MSNPFATATPGQLRVWLKWAVESTILDRLPPRYEVDGSGSPQGSEAYARALLAEMRNLDDGPRAPEEILADVRRFRAWVEARQKISRRIILADRREDSEHGAGIKPQVRPPSNLPRHRSLPAPPAYLPDFSPPSSDPMWDDWLDG